MLRLFAILALLLMFLLPVTSHLGKADTFATSAIDLSVFNNTTWVGTAQGLPPLQGTYTVDAQFQFFTINNGQSLNGNYRIGPYPNGYIATSSLYLASYDGSTLIVRNSCEIITLNVSQNTMSGFLATDIACGNAGGIPQIQFDLALSGVPNLTITSVTVTPTTTTPGGTITIADTTANTGTAAANASTNRYALKNAETGVQTPLTSTRAVPQLAANGSSSGSVDAIVPQNIAPGDYYAVACVDAVSGETNLGDNCRASATTVKIAETMSLYRHNNLRPSITDHFYTTDFAPQVPGNSYAYARIFSVEGGMETNELDNGALRQFEIFETDPLTVAYVGINNCWFPGVQCYGPLQADLSVRLS